MSLQILPINSTPNQTFSITLEVDGQNLTLIFFFTYNETAGYWTMTISDQLNNVLLTSIPLIPADYPYNNILRQYAYLKIGSCYIQKIGNNNELLPGPDTLGTEWQIVWGDTP